MVRSVRIAALAVLWLVPSLIFSHALSGNWVATWRTFGVPSMTPPFLDLYGIPVAVETMRAGGDPMVANPADPMHRTINYPRIWLYLFSAARITRANVRIVALSFCGLYLICMSFLILKTKHGIDALILLAGGLSVAPMFAMERGNNDLIVFSLVFLACVVANKYVKSALLGSAGLLKIYPISGMVVDALRRPVKDRLFAALFTTVVIFLMVLQWHDLNLIRHGTPVSRTMSYGALSLAAEILHETLPWGFMIGQNWAVIAACWLAAALAIKYAWGNSTEMDAFVPDWRIAEMFSVFGGIYVFTYAVGSNWGYRLIFLLPTLPFAMEMIRSVRHKGWGIGYLILVGIAENSVGSETSGVVIACHIATFALFILLITMLASQAKQVMWEANRTKI